MKKTLKIAGIIFGTLILLFLIYFAYVTWQIKTGRLIKGVDKWYTRKEIQEKYAPYDVPAKNTPEEVYAKFRNALLKNDIEAALGEIREEKREEYREAFGNKEKFDKWVKSLPLTVNNVRIDGNYGYYNWDKKDGYSHSIDFIKNKNGYWLIDII